MVALGLLFGLTAFSSNGQAQETRQELTGIRNSANRAKRLDADDLKRIESSLEELTGLKGIVFDQDGKLSLKEAIQDQPGSATAREILLRALDTVSITLEDHSGSPQVAFAALVPGAIYYLPAGERVEAFAIRVDLQDFKFIGGDEDAVKAFSLGFVLLHELVHAVEKKHDPVGAKGLRELGDCETIVNRVRMELNLPVRTHYAAEKGHGGPCGHLWVERIKFVRPKLNGDRIEQEVYSIEWPSALVTK